MVENSRKRRRIIGQCEEGKPQGAMGKWPCARAEMQVKQWFGVVPDFIITLDAECCRACGDAEFMVPRRARALPRRPRDGCIR
ncbi:putative metallopeptidase [Sinorhizobium meliloti]|uniref:putative metallopeptidase n=1 Tax=Rhizobium meliloti TaxID=382 RepID=UPI003B522F22